MVETSPTTKSRNLNTLLSTWALAAITCLACLVLVSCTKKTSSVEKKTLRILSWSDYFTPQAISSFEEKHQVRVQLDFFSSNEELLAKVSQSVESKSQGYDLILPSDYMVSSMIQLQLLRPLEKSKLPVIHDLVAHLQNPPYNPGLTHSLPFAVGTTGFAININKTKLFTHSLQWKDVFENPSLKSQVTLLDDPKEVIHGVLMMKGKLWSSATVEDIRQAFEYLKANKKNIRAFTGEAKAAMENGECAVCHAFSGDVFQAQQSKSHLLYVVPKEGATIWTDNLAMPVNAKEVDLAYAFMNHMLEANNAKEFIESTFFGSPNTKAWKLLSPAFAKNPWISLDAHNNKRLWYIHDRPDLLQALDKGWTEYKSQN
jgi:spermidine/putrescine transport system substrate-binding protein